MSFASYKGINLQEDQPVSIDALIKELIELQRQGFKKVHLNLLAESGNDADIEIYATKE